MMRLRDERMRKAKLVLLVTIALIAGIIAAFLWLNLQGKRDSRSQEEPKVTAEDTKMNLEKVHFVEDKGGKITWELEAQSVQQYEDQNLLVLRDVKVTVYTKEGRSFVISGKEGRVNQDSKNAELSGNVTLTSSDGYRLRTHSVAYDHQARKVTTPDPVEIEGDQLRVQGKGMVVDMEARTFRIMNRVKTQWRREGKG
jgi:LPS export ABC transporter protein LptC